MKVSNSARAYRSQMSDEIDDAAAPGRARRLRERIAAQNLTLAEFARRAYFSRNVMYALAKGRATKPDERKRIDAVLGPERP